MAGPSDITNMLNEALGALNKISSTQADVSKKLNDEQEKISEKSKKLSKVLKNTVEQFDMFQETKIEKEKKKKNTVVDLLKKTTDSIEKAAKKKTVATKAVVPKQTKFKDSIEKLNVSNSNISIRGNLILNSKSIGSILGEKKKSQSLDSFYDKGEDPLVLEELSLLRSIEEKLGSPSGTGEGLFDSLFGGIGGLAKMFSGAGSMDVGGVLAGMFGLSKFKKLSGVFKPLMKIKSSFPKLASAGGLLKNPKLLIPAIVVGAGLAAWGAVDMVKDGVFTKDFDEIDSKKTRDSANAEQREKGGLVNSGKPYIVGEKGPELFTPRESGKIVPNDKLGYSNQSDITEIIELIKDNNRQSKKVFNFFMEKVADIIKFFIPGNIFKLIKKVVGNVATTAKDVVREKVSNIVVAAKEKVNSVSTGMGFPNFFAPQPLNYRSPQNNIPSAPAKRIGDKNVVRDTKAILHKGEMIVPAAQSEALRATAILNNQPFRNTSTPETIVKNQLSEQFWMEAFVPKFAEMIKTKKTTDNIKVYDIGNVFGTY